MCWSCHQNLSNENITSQLENTINDPRFDKWNSCSISHLLIIGTGYNGESNQEKANKLLQRYKNYLLNNLQFLRFLQVTYWQSTFKIPTQTQSLV